MLQIGPTVTSNSLIGPYEGFQDGKKTVETGSQNIHLPERALTEAVKTGLSKTKLLPNM